MATSQQLKNRSILYDEADEYRKKALEKINRMQKKYGEEYTFTRMGIDEKKLDFTRRSRIGDIRQALDEVRDFVDKPAKYRITYVEEEKKNPLNRWWVLSSELKEYDELLSAENRTKAMRMGAVTTIQGNLKEKIGTTINKTIVTRDKYGNEKVRSTDTLVNQDFMNANSLNVIKLPSGKVIGQKGLANVIKKTKQEMPNVTEITNVRRHFYSNLANLQMRSTTSISEKNRRLKHNFISAILKEAGMSLTDDFSYRDLERMLSGAEDGSVSNKLLTTIRRINSMTIGNFLYLYNTSSEFDINSFIYSNEDFANMLDRLNTQMDTLVDMNEKEKIKLEEFNTIMEEAGLI